MKIFGADIETVKGEPKLLTITSKLEYDAVKVIHTNKNKIKSTFLLALMLVLLFDCYFHFGDAAAVYLENGKIKIARTYYFIRLRELTGQFQYKTTQ